MNANHRSNGTKDVDLLRGATMPTSSHGCKVLVALEGQASGGVCLSPTAFFDLPLCPFDLVSSLICTASKIRGFVLSVAGQHIGSCVPVDRIPDVHRRGRR